MRKIIISNLVSVDGYFEGPNADISWHNINAAFNKFSIEQLHSADTILFGRKTYQLMESYWPTEAAIKNDPVIAERMNNTAKVVFSTTLHEVSWTNTRLVKNNMEQAVLQLKKQPGKDVLIFGSADFSSHLINAGLIDEFRIIISPIILGKGNLLFNRIESKVKLELIKSVPFSSGNVLLCYKPVMQ